ncbi:Uncharacterised protein [BD1-7 clade bacterium]|uniref:TcdA/TcdB toxin pore forming domain-containing protein n=1 Tax=BD1-7 clade bacterium TaxID=2029982 RepID=A0A5S9QKT5_9GAMM|nr:Uncharacterised protein [BD1-7 clade bacterium]
MSFIERYTSNVIAPGSKRLAVLVCHGWQADHQASMAGIDSGINTKLSFSCPSGYRLSSSLESAVARDNKLSMPFNLNRFQECYLVPIEQGLVQQLATMTRHRDVLVLSSDVECLSLSELLPTLIRFGYKHILLHFCRNQSADNAVFTIGDDSQHSQYVFGLGDGFNNAARDKLLSQVSSSNNALRKQLRSLADISQQSSDQIFRLSGQPVPDFSTEPEQVEQTINRLKTLVSDNPEGAPPALLATIEQYEKTRVVFDQQSQLLRDGLLKQEDLVKGLQEDNPLWTSMVDQGKQLVADNGVGLSSGQQAINDLPTLPEVESAPVLSPALNAHIKQLFAPVEAQATANALQAQGRNLSVRLRQDTQRLQMENQLASDYVPVLGTLKTLEGVASVDGGVSDVPHYQIDMVNSSGDVQSVSTTEHIFDEVKTFIEEELPHSLPPGVMPNGHVETLGERQIEADGISSLNTAFAMMGLLGYFETSKKKEDAFDKNMTSVLTAHQYVSMARAGFGVAIDAFHIIKLAKLMVTTTEDTAKAAVKTLAFSSMVATGGIDVLLSSASVGFDIYELVHATTSQEKLSTGLQLAFDSGGALLGAGTLGLGITGSVAAAIATSETVTAATAATASSIASTAAALGAGTGGVGVIAAGIGIGILALVDTYSQVDSDAEAVGRYFNEIDKTYKNGGFTYDKKKNALVAVGAGIVRKVDLRSGVVSFGEHKIYSTHHGSSGSGKKQYFFWAGDMPQVIHDASKAISVRSRIGYSSTAELDSTKRNASVLVLPISPDTDTIDFSYNTLPFATSMHFDGADILRRMNGDNFDYDFYIFPSDYTIDRINFDYRRTGVEVDLDDADRTLVVPEIPKEFVGKIYHDLYGDGGDYSIALTDHAEIYTHSSGSNPSTWVLDGTNLDDHSIKVKGAQIQIGSAVVGVTDKNISAVLIHEPGGDISTVDFSHQKAIVSLVNGEAEIAGDDDSGGSSDGKKDAPVVARKDLLTHLRKLESEGRLNALTAIRHLHTADGTVYTHAYYQGGDDKVLYAAGFSDAEIRDINVPKETPDRVLNGDFEQFSEGNATHWQLAGAADAETHVLGDQFGPGTRGQNKLDTIAGQTVFQDISTDKGHLYRISLDQASIYGHGEFELLWNGEVVANFSIDGSENETAKNWIPRQVQVTATGDTSRLSIRGIQNSLVDNVQMHEVSAGTAAFYDESSHAVLITDNATHTVLKQFELPQLASSAKPVVKAALQGDQGVLVSIQGAERSDSGVSYGFVSHGDTLLLTSIEGDSSFANQLSQYDDIDLGRLAARFASPVQLAGQIKVLSSDAAPTFINGNDGSILHVNADVAPQTELIQTASATSLEGQLLSPGTGSGDEPDRNTGADKPRTTVKRQMAGAHFTGNSETSGSDSIDATLSQFAGLRANIIYDPTKHQLYRQYGDGRAEVVTFGARASTANESTEVDNKPADFSDNLVANGDFQAVTMVSDTIGAIADWHADSTIFGDKSFVFQDTTTYGPGANGDNKLDLDGGKHIYQDIKTIPGQKYVLAFDQKGLFGIGEMEVWFGGEKQAGFSVTDSDPVKASWTTRLVELTATDSTTRLDLKGISSSMIDNVRLYAGTRADFEAHDTLSEVKPDDQSLLAEGNTTPPAQVQKIATLDGRFIATTAGGLDWELDSSGHAHLVSVSSSWMDDHKDWHTDMQALLGGQALSAATGAIMIAGITLKKRNQAEPQPMRVWYLPKTGNMVFARLPEPAPSLSLLLVSQDGTMAWMYDSVSHSLYSQLVTGADVVTHALEDGRMINEASDAQLVPEAELQLDNIQTVSVDAGQILATTAKGLTLLLGRHDTTVVNIDSQWSGRLDSLVNQGYRLADVVTETETTTPDNQAQSVAWWGDAHTRYSATALHLAKTDNVSLLGRGRHGIYLSVSSREPEADVELVQLVNKDNMTFADKRGTFESIRLDASESPIASNKSEKGAGVLTLIYGSESKDTDIPLIQGLSRLRLEGARSNHNIHISESVFDTYQHITIDQSQVDNGGQSAPRNQDIFIDAVVDPRYVGVLRVGTDIVLNDVLDERTLTIRNAAAAENTGNQLHVKGFGAVRFADIGRTGAANRPPSYRLSDFLSVSGNSDQPDAHMQTSVDHLVQQIAAFDGKPDTDLRDPDNSLTDGNSIKLSDSDEHPDKM